MGRRKSQIYQCAIVFAPNATGQGEKNQKLEGKYEENSKRRTNQTPLQKSLSAFHIDLPYAITFIGRANEDFCR
jgi:hypothetical protein